VTGVIDGISVGKYDAKLLTINTEEKIILLAVVNCIEV
jgi:hypothetical protein